MVGLLQYGKWYFLVLLETVNRAIYSINNDVYTNYYELSEYPPCWESQFEFSKFYGNSIPLLILGASSPLSIINSLKVPDPVASFLVITFNKSSLLLISISYLLS